MNDTKYKAKIEEEMALVKKELESVGRINPENPLDWEPKADRMDTHAADENEVADKIESFEGNMSILNQLEIRYNELKKALERIDNGTFGICSVCHEPIEDARMEANPAATTCIKHI